MNVKRKLLAAAVVSTFAVASGTASAVYLSETGTGQVLLFPYYTVNSVDSTAYATYVHLVNTSNAPKAVKVRFREAKNSRDVLDFNVYLSAHDVWTGTVSKSTTTDGAVLTTTDKTCTVPAIPAAGVAFRNYGYITNASLGLANNDSAGSGLDRTREGYIEVIEMGVPTTYALKNGDDFVTALTHVNGVPPGCAAIVASWATPDNNTTGAGSWFATNPGSVTAATGGLAGSSILINVASGTGYENEPTVLDSFWGGAVTFSHQYPGNDQPDMDSANPAAIVFNAGAAVPTTWGSGVDAVSSVLMRDSVMNEYSVNPVNGARTDWIVTFPTKNYYVGGVATTPFTQPFSATGTSCEPIGINYWDREEGPYSVAGGVDFSPSVGGEGTTLCWESNVISFRANGTPADSGVLGSGVQRNIELGAAFNSGWMRLTFTGANAADDGAGTTFASVEPVSFFGLPVIGYAVKSLTNGAVTAGVLANYGTSMAHKYTRDLVDDAPAN